MLKHFEMYALDRADARAIIGGVKDAKAQCRIGPPITCSGSVCTATDVHEVDGVTYDGTCSCTDANGNVTDSQLCETA